MHGSSGRGRQHGARARVGDGAAGSAARGAAAPRRLAQQRGEVAEAARAPAAASAAATVEKLAHRAEQRAAAPQPVLGRRQRRRAPRSSVSRTALTLGDERLQRVDGVARERSDRVALVRSSGADADASDGSEPRGRAAAAEDRLACVRSNCCGAGATSLERRRSAARRCRAAPAPSSPNVVLQPAARLAVEHVDRLGQAERVGRSRRPGSSRPSREQLARSCRA